MMNRSSYRRFLPLVLAIVAGLLVFGLAIQPRIAAAVQPDPVSAAWPAPAPPARIISTAT